MASEASIIRIQINGGGMSVTTIQPTLSQQVPPRFITPIFLHAGLVHLLLNMLAQLTVSAEVERDMGSIAFVIVYFAAGIFGYEINLSLKQ